MKLFIIRHAETTANTGTIILGGKEQGELSPRGKRQAAGLARRLGNEDIGEIYCSSLYRARQTAEKLAQGRKCDTFFCDELREIEAGKLVGLSHEQAEAEFPNAFNDSFAKPSKKLPGGENMLEVQNRVMPLVNKILEKNGGQATVIVSHNVVNRVIIATLLGIPLEKARCMKIKNACVALLDAKPGFAQLYSLDNSLHGIR